MLELSPEHNHMMDNTKQVAKRYAMLSTPCAHTR